MADQSVKSGQEVAKQKRSRGRDLDYWRSRLIRATYTRGGIRHETPDWCVRIQHAGDRHLFNLGTPNQDAAAKRAKEIAAYVKAHGWRAAEARFKHADEKARVKAEKEAVTVGGYLRSVAEVATAQSPRTLAVYESCLRRVAAEIIGKPGKRPSREKIDATPLALLTATELEKWKAARLKACGGNPIAEDTAKTTMNSVLRSCRALFGKKFVPMLRGAGVVLPSPLPFSETALFGEDTSGKFSHDVAVADLVKAAATELAAPRGADESEPAFAARRQRYLAFVLVFAAGLRKAEADTLEWSAVDLDEGTITIRTTEYFRPKTKAAQKPVKLDPETVAILRGYRARARRDRFVLASEALPRPGHRHSFYRCDATWKALAAWLVRQGVTDPKPVHYLRKAITAHVAKRFGIYAAQRHARHTTPQVTARFYSDSDESVAPGVGALFVTPATEAESVVETDFSGKDSAGMKHKAETAIR